MDPREVVSLLDFYFSRFDEIIRKYDLEKIKTIGDAYMAVGGVNSNPQAVAIRAALAAIEIRDFILQDSIHRKKKGSLYWNVRIGIHIGDLIAGVLGKQKFAFDVWGDTVNIAARCEENAKPNHINLSGDFFNVIAPYFEGSDRGKIKIKNQGAIPMYFLHKIKPEYATNFDGELPNDRLRSIIGLPSSDLDGLRTFILNKLRSELNEALVYHSIEHTINVEQACLKYGKLEGLSERELLLVRTAALFHDTGFLMRYLNNETIGAQMVQAYAPQFGYSDQDISTIEKIIMATNSEIEPENLMEQILCDADHDYLGRIDYHHVANMLFIELEHFQGAMNEIDRIMVQIDYLENKHRYYTSSAINLRREGKLKRIQELKKKLRALRKKNTKTRKPSNKAS